MNLSRNILLLLMALSFTVVGVGCKEAVDEATEGEDDDGTDDTTDSDSGTSDDGAGGGGTGNGTSDDSDSSASSTVDCYGSDTTDIDSDVPDWIKDNFVCSRIYLLTENNVEYIVIETDDVPNHNSPYHGEDSEYYESVPEGNNEQNFDFEEQEFVIKFPVTPTTDDPAVNVPGACGVAVNGVVFYQGSSSTGSLDDELQTMDNGNGHVSGGSLQYHYHGSPLYVDDHETSLLGIMLDGYPVYGNKEENGDEPTDLDTTGDDPTYGHTHPTSHFPNGTFHYHITDWDDFGVPILPNSMQGDASSQSQVSN